MLFAMYACPPASPLAKSTVRSPFGFGRNIELSQTVPRTLGPTQERASIRSFRPNAHRYSPTYPSALRARRPPMTLEPS
jgi:hypothetical protein